MIIKPLTNGETKTQPKVSGGTIKPLIDTSKPILQRQVENKQEPIQITPTQKKIDLKQIGGDVIKTVKEKAPAIIGRLSFALAKTVMTDPYKVVGDKVREGIVEKVKSIKVEKPQINKESVGESFKKTFDKTPLGTATTTAKKTKDVVSGFFKESKADSERLGGQNFPAKPESKFTPSNKDEALGSLTYNLLKDIFVFESSGQSQAVSGGIKTLGNVVKGSTFIAPKIAKAEDILVRLTNKKVAEIINKFSKSPLTFEDIKDVTAGRATPDKVKAFKQAKESGLLDEIIKAHKASKESPKIKIFDFLKRSIDDIKKSLKTKVAEEQKLLTSGEKVTKDQIEQIIGTGEQTSQEVIGKIVGAGLEKTPNGKKIIKLATEAQKNGQNIVVNTISEATDVLPTKTEVLKSTTEAPSLEKSVETGTKDAQAGLYDATQIKQTLSKYGEKLDPKQSDKLSNVVYGLRNFDGDVSRVLTPREKSLIDEVYRTLQDSGIDISTVRTSKTINPISENSFISNSDPHMQSMAQKEMQDAFLKDFNISKATKFDFKQGETVTDLTGRKFIIKSGYIDNGVVKYDVYTPSKKNSKAYQFRIRADELKKHGQGSIINSLNEGGLQGVSPLKGTPPSNTNSNLPQQPSSTKGVEGMTSVKDTTKELIEATKTEKDVKKALSNIKKSYEELTAEAEGKAVLSQEQRSGINTTDVATLKRIYANSKVFQEGDIETIRNSKSGELLNRVIENIQEKNPMMSEQEAFEYALNLPTKESERVKITPDIKSLKERQKVLNDYLEVLSKKQTDLSIKQSDELYNEWNSVMSAQEKLAKIVEVPTEQLPIGTGKEKVSKLEAKIKGVLKNVSQEQIDQLGISTYKQMSNEETIRKASEYVVNNPENALKVLSGEIMPPKGLNSNSIFVAMANNADDTELVRKLATLKSTAMGQNIEILRELDPDSPIRAMTEVIKIREAEFEKRFKGKKVKDVIKNEVERIKKEMPRLDKFDVAKFLDEIECK